MSVIMAPIQQEKVEDWKSWSKEINGPKKEELENLNKRYNLTRHDAWLAETDSGTSAIVMHEGPGAKEFIPKLAESDNEFDKWFRSKISEFHGMDFSKGPNLEPLDKYIDSGRNNPSVV